MQTKPNIIQSSYRLALAGGQKLEFPPQTRRVLTLRELSPGMTIAVFYPGDSGWRIGQISKLAWNPNRSEKEQEIDTDSGEPFETMECWALGAESEPRRIEINDQMLRRGLESGGIIVRSLSIEELEKVSHAA